MTNTKVVGASFVVLAVLAALYIGNLVVRTTPSSSAFGSPTYKVINSISKCSGEAPCMEKLLNDTSKDGWEFVNEDSGFMIFRK